MKNIKKKFGQVFKILFYKIFSLIYGKIKGKINFNDDSRIKVEIVEKENNLKYKIYRITNGRFYTDRIHDAAVILDNFIVEGPSYQLRTINNADVKKNIVFQKGTPRIKKKINGKVLSLLTGGGGNTNYFHWMFDVLPRFALCEKILDLDKIDFFLLPSIEKKFHKETLDLLNISPEKRISSKFFRHFGFSELFVTDHPHNIENDATKGMQNIPIWISKWLKEKYINSKTNSEINLPKKIYIERSDSTANTKNLRQIINEKEVKNFLINKGFQSITLGNLHFNDQVKIFNNAEIITGLHGAGFANLCFCKAGTKIVELKNNTAGRVIEHLAVTNQLIYKSISCQSFVFDEQSQFGHIKVPIDSLEKIIEGLH